MIIAFIVMLVGWIISEWFVKYESYSEALKVISRIVIIIPLIIISLYSPNQYGALILLMLMMIIAADSVLILDQTIGGIIFMFIHALLILNIILVYPIFNMVTVALIAIAIIIIIIKWSDIWVLTNGFPMILYFMIITIELICAINLLQYFSIFSVFVWGGVLLFYACDIEVLYIINVRKFKYYQQLNHLLYYGGLLLLAISGRYL